MAKLTSARRKKLPESQFALPGSRKYPIDTATRAANAKARAQQQFNEGGISKSTLEKIDAAANKVLKRRKKGK